MGQMQQPALEYGSLQVCPTMYIESFLGKALNPGRSTFIFGLELLLPSLNSTFPPMTTLSFSTIAQTS